MARSFRKEIKEPDSFQLFAEKAVDWYQSNARAVLGSAVAVVVVVGAIVGYIVWSAQVRERAGIALAIAETASKNPLSPETENALRLAADGYPGTKPGIIARLRLAALLAERGDTAPAERSTAGFSKRRNPSPRPTARLPGAASRAAWAYRGNAPTPSRSGGTFSPREAFWRRRASISPSGDVSRRLAATGRPSRPTRSSSRSTRRARTSRPA